jgi:hypothetical protein
MDPCPLPITQLLLTWGQSYLLAFQSHNFTLHYPGPASLQKGARERQTSLTYKGRKLFLGNIQKGKHSSYENNMKRKSNVIIICFRAIVSLSVYSTVKKSHFEKLIVTQLVKKLPIFYEIRKLVSVSTRVHQCTL